jgi:hypothetical protein
MFFVDLLVSISYLDDSNCDFIIPGPNFACRTWPLKAEFYVGLVTQKVFGPGLNGIY